MPWVPEFALVSVVGVKGVGSKTPSPHKGAVRQNLSSGSAPIPYLLARAFRLRLVLGLGSPSGRRSSRRGGPCYGLIVCWRWSGKKERVWQL
jgi:hypothetical protein